ncbi:MarR family transcriptional regulator [Candidatus Woesearchaeota archaeon]|nr:MarR family transcriptional regulator [Candidatus Woesearchaeota archaeon]
MELNFACKKFPIDQVLRCSFGLSNPEFRILKVLLSKGEKSVEDVAEILGKDRTTVQRSMKTLVAKGLVKRRQYNLDNGGYQYHYLPQDKAIVKERIQQHFESFAKNVRDEIESW